MTPTRIFLIAASVLAPACTADSLDTPTPPNAPPPGSTSGDQDSTFDHENDGISPWDLVQRLEEEGLPKYTSHVHSCPKVRVRTLGNLLASVGVNVTNQTPLSAGDLYNSGYNALGGPNFANRIRENVGITTSGASREFDIFAAGAPEVIAAFTAGTIARCPGVKLFDSSNACQPEGITCLTGVPATAEHVQFCNLTVTSASDVPTGQKLAVAAILAAAYTCE